MAFFDVRRGEGAVVLRTTLTLFGLIAAHTMLETARDALFLEALPASRLPLVYVLLAGLSVVAAKGNTRFVAAFGRRNALVITLLAAAYGTIVFYLIPRSAAAIFGLYVWSALLGTVLVVQFWMYCGQLYTVAQGSRLFGLVTAGGVLGAVTGASAAVGVLRMIPVEALLLVAAGIFLGTSGLLTTLDVDTPDAPPQRGEAPARSGPGLFKDYPYLLRISALLAVSTSAVLITDYLFKSAAARAFPPEELGTFFAQYYAVLNAVALVVQVFVAGQLVNRAGVISAFLVLPLMLLAGGIASVLLGGVFLAVLVTKGADGALRHSLHRITTELLWLPLPDRVRAQSKAFVDTVVVRSVQAVIAGLLLLLAMFDLDSTRVLGGLIAGLAALWAASAIALRGPYLDLFRHALNRNTPDERRNLQLDLNSVELVVEALSSRDEIQVVAAIDLLAASDRARLIPALILYHESEAVLIRSLEAIGTKDRRDWIPLAERLLDHKSPQVRVAALKALARKGDRLTVEKRMLDINPYVRAHAAFWLAQTHDGDLVKDPAVSQILAMGGEAGAEAQVGLLEAIREDGDQRWVEVISELAKSSNDRVVETAVLAIGKVRDDRFIPLLIDRLGLRAGRDVVRDAIASMGDPALDALEAALGASDTPRQVRRHIPRTISRFDSLRAVQILTDHLGREKDGAVRFKILRGLGRLVASTSLRVEREAIERRLHVELLEYLRLLSLRVPIEAGLETTPEAARSGRLLVGLLTDKMNQALERIFRLLQIAHRNEDLRSVSFAVRSNDKRVRAQALEFLSALTLSSSVPENRDLIRIIMDDMSEDEQLERVHQLLPHQPTTHRAAVLRLLEDEDESLAGIATYHGLEIGGFQQEVIDASKDGLLRRQVKTMLEGISGLREAPSVA